MAFKKVGSMVSGIGDTPNNNAPGKEWFLNAQDNKYYANDNAGTQWVYNPQTGNAAANRGGSWVTDSIGNFNNAAAVPQPTAPANNTPAMQAPAPAAAAPANNAGYTKSGSKIYANGNDGKLYVMGLDENGGIGIGDKQGNWQYVLRDDPNFRNTLEEVYAKTDYFGGYQKPDIGVGGVNTSPAMVNMEASIPDLNIGNNYAELLKQYGIGLQDSYEGLAGAIDRSTAYQQELANQAAEKAKAVYEHNNVEAMRDYQRNINPYGYNAEALAQMGLGRSGYAESSIVAYGSALSAALSQNRISYAEALQDIEARKLQAVQEGDWKKAEAFADLQNSISSAALQLGNANIGNILDAQNRAAAWQREDAQAAAAWQRESEQRANEQAFQLQRDAINHGYSMNEISAKNTADTAGKTGELFDLFAEDGTVPDEGNNPTDTSVAADNGKLYLGSLEMSNEAKDGKFNVDGEWMTKEDIINGVSGNTLTVGIDDAAGSYYIIKATGETGGSGTGNKGELPFTYENIVNLTSDSGLIGVKFDDGYHYYTFEAIEKGIGSKFTKNVLGDGKYSIIPYKKPENSNKQQTDYQKPEVTKIGYIVDGFVKLTDGSLISAENAEKSYNTGNIYKGTDSSGNIIYIDKNDGSYTEATRSRASGKEIITVKNKNGKSFKIAR